MTTPSRHATRATDLLGIEHPILAGRMQWLSDAPYVAAVARAGGAWRVLRNDTSAEGARLEQAGGRSFEDFRHLIAGSITRDHAYERGERNRGMVSISPAAGVADRVEPMQAIFGRLLQEMAVAEDRLGAMKARALDAASRMREAKSR